MRMLNRGTLLSTTEHKSRGLSLQLQWCQSGRSLLVIYYVPINSYEVTDGPLADHSGTVVLADSGSRLLLRNSL